MSKDKIERAIKKAQGGDAENYDEVRYEGYGPGGVALIVEALTDNRNRTAADVRAAFSKYGGAMGETDSVAFMFNRVGSIAYPANSGQRRRDAGSGHRGGRRRSASPPRRPRISLQRRGFRRRARRAGSQARRAASAAIVWRPQNMLPVKRRARGETLVKLIDVLDDHDDVQNVYGNYELSDALMEKLSAA